MPDKEIEKEEMLHTDNCTCEEKGDTCQCPHKEEKKKEKKEKKKNITEELQNQIKELENKVLSEKAELINYRKRKDEEVSYMLKYAHEDIALEILPIVDNFERAIKLDDDNLEDELSKFLEGFKMIYCHLIKVLESFGVKAIDGNNKPFDATYHQGVMTEAKEGVEPGMVLEVLQKGYLLKDKVIRPAMVKVSE
ncbi:MAG: nucleotide exchange factor GrpE [Bacilli bacterium]|nr:nucleotide exchange factor GrpE [Bacilli bacterium]